MKRVANFKLQPFYPRWNVHQHPLDKGSQTEAGRHVRVKTLVITGTRTPTVRSSSPYPFSTNDMLAKVYALTCSKFLLSAVNRGLEHSLNCCYLYMGWSGTKSTFTMAICWHNSSAVDDRWWCLWSSRWNIWSSGKTQVLGEDLSQCRSVHQRSHMTWPELETWMPRWEAGD
jgi:hypothetical protein